MEYRTSKDMSLVWGITPKRINVLAKQGRIPGAKLIGNTWMIPRISVKPTDKRYSKNKVENSYYRFPILLCQTYGNKNFTATLTKEEKLLLSAEKLFAENRRNDAYPTFQKLASSSKLAYIRISAFYHLAFTDLLNQNFDLHKMYSKKLSEEINSLSGEHPELILLERSISALIKGNLELSIDTDFIHKLDFKIGSYTFVTKYMFYSNVLALLRGEGNTDFNIYEFVASSYSKDDSPYITNELYTYIALMYRVIGDEENTKKYLRIALDIACKHHVYNALSEIAIYIYEYLDELLVEYPPELKEILQTGSQLYIGSINAIAVHYNGTDVPTLRKSDFRYISYAINNIPNKVIAIDNHISEAAVSKKYQSLCNKFKVANKAELREKLVHSVSNPYLIVK